MPSRSSFAARARVHTHTHTQIHTHTHTRTHAHTQTYKHTLSNTIRTHAGTGKNTHTRIHSLQHDTYTRRNMQERTRTHTRKTKSAAIHAERAAVSHFLASSRDLAQDGSLTTKENQHTSPYTYSVFCIEFANPCMNTCICLPHSMASHDAAESIRWQRECLLLSFGRVSPETRNGASKRNPTKNDNRCETGGVCVKQSATSLSSSSLEPCVKMSSQSNTIF